MREHYRYKHGLYQHDDNMLETCWIHGPPGRPSGMKLPHATDIAAYCLQKEQLRHLLQPSGLAVVRLHNVREEKSWLGTAYVVTR